MEITEIPFNQFVGLKKSEQADLGMLVLDDLPHYRNHLNTVHAAAQFALAEACSGEYLLSRFGEFAAMHIPVVRRAEVKYRSPASGRVYAKATVSEEQLQKFMADLNAKGHALLSIDVSVLDTSGTTTMRATFEWFVQRMGEGQAGIAD